VGFNKEKVPMLPRFFRRRQNLLQTILETMEPRRLLSGTLIQGTAGDDRIVIGFGSKAGDVVIVEAPGFASGTLLHNTRMFAIDGGAGDDYIEIQKGGYPEANRRLGGNWVTLRGGNGNDTLIGGDNGTDFVGGPGNDEMTGRQPAAWTYYDSLIFTNAPARIVARFDLGEIQEDGYGGHDIITGGIGNLEGTDFDDIIYAGPFRGWMGGGNGNDLIVADPSGSTLSGEAGNDTLLGGDADDLLVPGIGDDQVSGGGGINSLEFDDYRGVTHGAVIRLDYGIIEDDGSGGVDHLFGIQNVSGYGLYGDTIIGDAQDNVLLGGDGADFIFGGAGNDTIQGGNSATVLGGSGDDRINTDHRINFIDGGAGADTIELRGFDDSEDHIIPDEADTILDHRDYGPRPADYILPPFEVLPFETPAEDGPGQQPIILNTAATERHKIKKLKRHHKVKKHPHRDVPIAARLFKR